MAANTAAARLTEAHRLAQARLGARTVSQMLAVWPLLDIDALDDSFPRWLRASIPIIQGNRRASAQLAANYYATFRNVTLGLDAGTFAPPLAGPASVEAVTGALVITGPAAIKKGILRGVPVTQAEAVAQTESARAAMYHSLQGGRDAIAEAVAADPQAVGYARAASGDACAFCAMLASRGPVYSEDTVDFEAHPGCHCEPEPQFSRNDPWPAGSRDYQRLWNDSQRDLPKKDRGLNAFRRHIAAERAPAPEPVGPPSPAPGG